MIGNTPNGQPPCDEAYGCAVCLIEDVCELDRAKTLPLFDKSLEGIEREDEWSGPHGFLFDPMTRPTKAELSKQFLDAADQLVETILRREVADYTVAYPAIFLYRHAIELVLKCALGGDARGHKLDELADTFARRCKEQYGQDVPDWVNARLKEIADVDPNSTAFRYAENFDRQLKRDVPIRSDFHVDLRHLQRSMSVLHAALNGVVGKIREPDVSRKRTGGSST